MKHKPKSAIDMQICGAACIQMVSQDLYVCTGIYLNVCSDQLVFIFFVGPCP
jgi:hypothetical protein